MACGDVLSLEDLQTAKKHQIFEAEVITGKAGGVAGGVSIDYATNQVTGQVQKTMPAILRDLGFEPATFDFTTGGTLSTADRNKAVLWSLSSGGDGYWYYWAGALPKVIPAASTPASTGGVIAGAWRPVGDITLRGDLAAGNGASLVGFTQAGTGTANRTTQDKLRENVSLSDFSGFVGDGVADDTASVIAASINVNLTRRKLTCSADKKIRLVGNAEITFNYSVDLGGATLDLSAFTGVIKFTRPTAPVEYLPGSAVVEALKAETNLTGRYFSGWANTTEVQDALVKIETTQPFYNYLGTDYSRTEINQSVRHGVMISPLIFTLPTSLITKVTVFKNEPRITTVGGFNLLLGLHPQENLIVFSHSHLRVHHVGLVQSDVTQAANPVVMSATQCLDIELRDVVTNWPSLTATTGAYIFSAFRCYNIRFIDCVGDGDGWGAVGTSACQRISFRRCNLSRIDSHHPFMERMDIDDCKLGVNGITASGIGDMNISDTEFDFDQWPGLDSSISSFIRSRTDVGGLMAGDLNINRCKFKNKGGSTLQFLVAQLNTSGGVPAGSPIPYQFFNSINIDGISIDSDTEINIFPKLQQNSGCKMPSKLSYSDVSGTNLICWEQSLSGLTPAFPTVNSQVNNVALRGTPNINLSLRDVTLSRKGISFAESDATQDWLFDITIDNLRQQSGETVYPEIELYVGGEVSIDGSIIEGLDFFLGAFSTKPIHVTMTGGAIKHTGAYNSTLLNGFNGYQKVNLNGVHLYGLTASSLQSSYSATLNGCLWFLNDAPYSPGLTPDMAGVAGTYTLTNKDASLKNRYEISLGTGSAISSFPLNLPAAGGGTYVQTSQASAVTITRSSDGTSITTAFTGTPYVRNIAIV